MDFSRRGFLQSTSGVITLAALGGCEWLNEQIRNRPVRRDISTLASNDPTLEAYRDAVGQMQALPTSDPRNWTQQAGIHQNFCPHGNWFFLPWHRAYLLSFERICQELTGESTFGLPYWNWSCNRSIPSPFWESGSPLNHSPRTATAMSVANEAIVGPMKMDTILSETDFELFASGAATALRGGGGFYGAIEGTPHNYIHGFIGGTMGSFMSPLDPVFWTHHNVIDYFWLAWNQRGNANTNDPTYVDFDIAGHMVDGEGNPVSYRVGTLILAPLLSYRFEPPAPCGIQRFTTLETDAFRRFLEQGAAVRFRIEREFQPSGGARLSVAEQSRVRLPLAAEPLRAFAATAEQRLVLLLSDVEAPPENDLYVQVYVNLPDGEEASVASESYAGSFAFFTDPSMQGMRYTHVVDLSETIARLRDTGQLDPETGANVTLIAAPVEPGRSARGVVSIGTLTPAMIPRLPPAVAPQ